MIDEQRWSLVAHRCAADDAAIVPAVGAGRSLRERRQTMETQAIMAALAGSEVLADLTRAERATAVSYGEPITVPSGATLWVQGDPGDSLLIVLDGRLEALRDGHVLGELTTGAVLGEMALFGDHRRTAAVIARESATLLRFEIRTFLAHVLRQEEAAVKLLGNVGRVMARRLQHLDPAQVVRAANDPAAARQLEQLTSLRQSLMADWALTYHSMGQPGKIAIRATKPAATAADLSVAYSPGVAQPCLRIRDDPDQAYALTSKGHLIGVISNGTAVLGLGDIGALASKPVMEGKAVLFKRFGGLDAFDIEVAEPDPQRLVDVICAIAPTFGGINLEDIKA
jgi:CRP-like cAMP-binding protein